MRYFQDPDTGNCYAIRETENMSEYNVIGVGPTQDKANSPCATYDMCPAMILADFTEVDRQTVLASHPRLLAYLDQAGEEEEEDPVW